MHCRPGDDLYTASDSAIEWLPESLIAFKYIEGYSFEINRYNKVKEIQFNLHINKNNYIIVESSLYTACINKKQETLS